MIDFECWWNVTNKAPADDAGVSTPPHRNLTPECVFHTYAGRVYNLARRLVEHEADAEDITQEVLLQVVRKLDTFRGESELATWLHRVTVNAVLALRRKRSYRPEFQTTSPLEQLSAGNAGHRAPSAPPEDGAVRQETRELIEQAIATLPPIYRDVLVLSDVEQFTNPEIGEVLGLSLAAVKSRLHRARQMMRTALAPNFGEDGSW